MEWFSEDRNIGLYGSTHLEAEIPEITGFLSKLDPMLVMVEADDNRALMPDMQAAVDFARSKQRQVAYIGYNIGNTARELGKKYPLHTAVHFGIITADQELTHVATEEELRGRVEFVLL